MLKRLIRYITVAVLIIGIFGANQFISVGAASAGTVPPPDKCGLGSPQYQYADPDCWGAAGNPPTNPSCFTGQDVNTTADCLAWKAKTPTGAGGPPPTHCAPNELVGADGVCCRTTDKACLDGTVSTPQGDAASLALAKAVCDQLKNLGNIDAGQIPYACSLPQPTLQAGIAGCYLALQVFGDNLSSPIWPACSALAIASAGNIPPIAAPSATDFATAKTICDLLNANKGSVKGTIPAGCATAKPQPQDAVLGCKLLLTGGFSDLLKGALMKTCTDIIFRNPANEAGTQTDATPVHVTFDDTSLKKSTGGLSWFALALCVGGIMFSGLLWAVGSKGNNEGQAHTGKRGIIVCCVAALIIGGLPAIFTFYDNLAHDPNVDTNHVTAAN